MPRRDEQAKRDRAGSDKTSGMMNCSASIAAMASIDHPEAQEITADDGFERGKGCSRRSAHGERRKQQKPAVIYHLVSGCGC